MAHPEQSPETEQVEAQIWWDRLREPGRSAETEQAFFAWLQAAPEHADAYLRVAATAATPVPRNEPTSAVAAPARHRWRTAAIAGLLLALGVGVAAIWMRTTNIREVHWVAPHGSRPVLDLEDGSQIVLASESEVTVIYTPGERLIHLDRGRAYFTVAKGDRRRFRVLAGDASVVATGTQFDVQMGERGELVSLLEGRIDVYADSLALDEGEAHEKSAVRSLTSGEQVVVFRGQVSRPTRVDAGSVRAWQHGQLIARGMALSDVVEEYNLYAVNPIRLADPELADIRIGGVFNLADTATFFEFLQSSLGIQVNVTSESVVELRRKGSAPVPAERQGL